MRYTEVDRRLWEGRMDLILSDRHIDMPATDNGRITFVDLSKLKIKNCVGCYGCWTKTPGRCVIRDDAVQVYPLIAASKRVMYVSRIAYGGYDTIMKTMLERSIPVQQAFIRLVDGETHHVQRSVTPKDAVIVVYGSTSAEEQSIFRRLVERNAKNMCFKSHRILFVDDDAVEQTVQSEVALWNE